jgi:hypothetical protein
MYSSHVATEPVRAQKRLSPACMDLNLSGALPRAGIERRIDTSWAGLCGMAGACAVVGLVTLGAEAKDLLTVESAYLGEGKFSYRINTKSVPTFGDYYLTSLNISKNCGSVSNTLPPGWSADVSSGWIDCYFSGTNQANPSSRTFIIETSATNYTIVSNGVYLAMMVTPYSGTTWGALVNVAAVVPVVTGGESAPTNLTALVEYPCEVQLNDPIITDGQPPRIPFTANMAMKLQVEQSADFVNWAAVGQPFSAQNGTNTATIDQSAPAGRAFFRMRIISRD